MAEIFEEFYQVKNSDDGHGGGFGLGLAIAERMARPAGPSHRRELYLGERNPNFSWRCP